MTDFKQAKIDALEQLSATNTVRVLDSKEKKALNLQQFGDVWLLSAEYFDIGKCAQEIELLIALPDDFPVVLPKIYITGQDYNKIKYIPHVDTAGYICLFEEDSISLDTDQPGNIVKLSLDRAIKIIEDGVGKKNEADFNDEFIAYWEGIYDGKDRVDTGITMINGQISNGTVIKFLHLKKAYSGYSVILHDESPDFMHFKSYLKENGHFFDECEAFYLGGLAGLTPPFSLLNSDTIEVVRKHFPLLLKEFEVFVNCDTYPKFVLFSVTIKEKPVLFGWQIHNLNVKLNGFRLGKITNWDAYTKFQKSGHVSRIKFDMFTRERLLQRTAGFNDMATKDIAVAGLGSIGSNLLHYLIPFGIDNMHLIDPDVLSIENTQRHLLGMEYVRQYKVNGIKHFLERNNPLQKIKAHKTSLLRVIREKVGILNQCDFIFLAVGKDNIERFAIESLKAGTIKKPVFILWVEPYLCGGHCLYLTPGKPLNFEALYDQGLFIYNVIDASEYKNKARQLLFREAGCQSSYLPYGQKNIILFLSRIASHIYEIMENRIEKNIRLTWRGNEEDRERVNLQLSDFGNKLSIGEIQVAELL